MKSTSIGGCRNGWALEATVLAVVIGVPLVVTVNTRDSTILKPTIAMAAVSLGLCIWLAKALISGQIVFVKTPLDVPILAYLGLGLLSLVVSRHRYFSGREFLRLLTSVGFFFLASQALCRRKQVVRVATVLLVVAGIAACYGLCQRAGLAILPGDEVGFPRSISTFGNANYFGGFLAGMIPLAMAFCLAKGPWRRSLAVLAALLLLAALVTTHTRGAWLALVAGIGVVVIYHRRELTGPRWIPAAMVFALVVGFFLLPHDVRGRLATLPTILKDPAAQARLRVWEAAINAFLHRPVLGHGLGTFFLVLPPYNPYNELLEVNLQMAAHAHCEYLELLVEQGMLGLAGFLWVMVTYMRKAIALIGRTRTRIHRELSVGLLGMVIVIAVHNLVSMDLRSISNGFVLWLAMAMTQGEDDPQGRVIRIRRFTPWRNTGVTYLIIFLLTTLSLALLMKDQVNLVRSSKAVFWGDLLLSRGKRMEAEDQYRQATRFDGHNLLAWYKLAYQQLRSNDLDGALASFGEIEKHAPYYPRLHFYRGLAYMGKEDRGNALVEFERAAKITDDFDNHFLIAQLRGEMDDAEAELRHLERAVANSGRSLRLLEEKRMAAVKYAWRDDLENIPKKLEELRKRVTRAYDLLVLHYARHGHWPRAIETFETAAAELPGDALIQSHLALAYEQNGLRDEAIAGYQRTLQLDPKRPEALAGLGRLSTKLAEAQELLRQAIDQSTELKRDGFTEDLAVVYFQHRSYELAEEAVQRSIELTPEEDLSARARRQYLLGVILIAQGDYGRAKNALQSARRSAPETPIAERANGLLTELAEDPQGTRQRVSYREHLTRFRETM